jgi:hypothetical protein
MAMTLAYLPLSPEVHPVQTKYTAPLSTAIQIPYKRKPETLSEQVVRLMDSRPRDQVSHDSILTKSKAHPSNTPCRSLYATLSQNGIAILMTMSYIQPV